MWTLAISRVVWICDVSLISADDPGSFANRSLAARTWLPESPQHELLAAADMTLAKLRRLAPPRKRLWMCWVISVLDQHIAESTARRTVHSIGPKRKAAIALATYRSGKSATVTRKF